MEDDEFTFGTPDRSCLLKAPPSGWGYLYLIEFPNGKSYVGITRKSIRKRVMQHSKASTKSVLHRAIMAHGESNVRVKAIGLFLWELLGLAEAAAISEHKTLSPSGYNFTSGGEGGYEIATEVRAKMSIIARARSSRPPIPQHVRDKISEANRGKLRSEEVRRRMSEAQKKRVLSPEAKENIRRAHLGTTHTPEVRARMSALRKGATMPEDTKKKISAALMGRKLSESHLEALRGPKSAQHRAALSIAARNRINK